MAFMYSEETYSLLDKTIATVTSIISQSEPVSCVNDYLETPWGMERLESTSMLLIVMGESLKGLDKLTDGALLSRYPNIDWKGAKGLRDVIAHNYFDLDAEVIFEVVKNELPPMLSTLQKMKSDIRQG